MAYSFSRRYAFFEIIRRISAKTQQKFTFWLRFLNDAANIYILTNEIVTENIMENLSQNVKKFRVLAEIHIAGKAAEILSQLHGWIDRAERVKALVYLKAAIEASLHILKREAAKGLAVPAEAALLAGEEFGLSLQQSSVVLVRIPFDLDDVHALVIGAHRHDVNLALLVVSL